MCSCTANKEIIENGKDDNVVASSNSASSHNPQDSLQGIEQRKEDLEQILYDNYEVFNQIVSYFENDTTRLNCRKDDGRAYQAKPAA